ncbi:MAG: RNA pyrophosphohydrolase [Oscillatoriales cyanobacterium SM2_2_1]|nr:RNA pyrophosphohydrolase [Oscillatoriales cyanobacterium SM2_2_1]
MMKKYRPNVGIVVFNRHGEVLMGERIGLPNSWQFPQGGIDEKEEPQTAMIRELYEEVGIAVSTEVAATSSATKSGFLVGSIGEWMYYDFPDQLRASLKGIAATYDGQKQQWYLVYWDYPADQCLLDIHEREFHQVRFIPFAEGISYAVDFKRAVYEQVYIRFQPQIEQFLATHPGIG